MHKFLVCACKSQDFAQSQKFFARSHGRLTAHFRNSALALLSGTGPPHYYEGLVPPKCKGPLGAIIFIIITKEVSITQHLETKG